MNGSLLWVKMGRGESPVKKGDVGHEQCLISKGRSRLAVVVGSDEGPYIVRGCDTDGCMDGISAFRAASVIDVVVGSDKGRRTEGVHIVACADLVCTNFVAHLLVVVVDGMDGSGEEKERGDEDELHGDCCCS